MPKPGSLLKKNFFAGLLVLAPLLVITWIIMNIAEILWRMNDFLPESWQPEHFLHDPTLIALTQFAFIIGAALLVAFGISFLGWISKRYLGQKLLQVISYLIRRIPVIRSIYSGLEQFMRTLASGGGKQFNRVVYVEYPRRDCWALAFVTSTAREPGLPSLPSGGEYLNVYIPTTPNPTSGFHLIVAANDVRECPMTVEEAFRTILSLGIAQPDAKPGARL